MPLVTKLNKNYPNPFNPKTCISYSLKSPGNVQLAIYNIKGQKVRTLVSEKQERGQHRVVWNGTDERNQKVASGCYFYRLETGSYHSTHKMVLMK